MPEWALQHPRFEAGIDEDFYAGDSHYAGWSYQKKLLHTLGSWNRAQDDALREPPGFLLAFVRGHLPGGDDDPSAGTSVALLGQGFYDYEQDAIRDCKAPGWVCDEDFSWTYIGKQGSAYLDQAGLPVWQPRFAARAARDAERQRPRRAKPRRPRGAADGVAAAAATDDTDTKYTDNQNGSRPRAVPGGGHGGQQSLSRDSVSDSHLPLQTNAPSGANRSHHAAERGHPLLAPASQHSSQGSRAPREVPGYNESVEDAAAAAAAMATARDEDAAAARDEVARARVMLQALARGRRARRMAAARRYLEDDRARRARRATVAAAAAARRAAGAARCRGGGGGARGDAGRGAGGRGGQAAR